MIFLDTNILVDVLEARDEPGAIWSRGTLQRLSGDNRLVANLIVVAELASELASAENVAETLAEADVQLVDLTIAAALRASDAYREYRRRGGTRQAILPDFLIAGHAAAIAARFMTRDRRLGGYFPDLALITPETHP